MKAKGKLLAVAALSAASAAAFAADPAYVVYPNGTTAQVVQPPNEVSQRAPMSAPVTGQVVVPAAPAGTVVSSSGQPVTTGTPVTAYQYPNGQIVYANTPLQAYTLPNGQVVYSNAPVTVTSGVPVAASVPVTQEPAQSGPGAVDKTRPGMEPWNGVSSRDSGTSSAGSN